MATKPATKHTKVGSRVQALRYEPTRGSVLAPGQIVEKLEAPAGLRITVQFDDGQTKHYLGEGSIRDYVLEVTE